MKNILHIPIKVLNSCFPKLSQNMSFGKATMFGSRNNCQPVINWFLIHHSQFIIHNYAMNFFTKNQSSLLPNKEQTLVHLDYEITYDALPHESFSMLPPNVQKHGQELYRLIRTNPKQAIAPLLELIEEYGND